MRSSTLIPCLRAADEAVHGLVDTEEPCQPVEEGDREDAQNGHQFEHGGYPDLLLVLHHGPHNLDGHLLLLEDRQEARKARLHALHHARVHVERFDDGGLDARVSSPLQLGAQRFGKTYGRVLAGRVVRLPVVTQYSARTLTAKTASILSSGISRSRRPLMIPALLTTISTGPTLALTSPAM